MAGQLAAYGYKITGNEIYTIFHWLNGMCLRACVVIY